VGTAIVFNGKKFQAARPFERPFIPPSSYNGLSLAMKAFGLDLFFISISNQDYQIHSLFVVGISVL
jgi:hypothetical protein